MEFTLVYRGPLKANRGATDKHVLRQVFHKQLAILWSQQPLIGYRELVDPNVARRHECLLRDLGQYQFAPLVSPSLALIAELRITLLRPEPPGSLITQGGDIDNRMKTLLDALRMPRVKNEIPKSASPAQDETPFYCLLEDDNLVTKLTVATDRLLEPTSSPSEVHLLIHVTTKRTHGTYANVGFA